MPAVSYYLEKYAFLVFSIVEMPIKLWIFRLAKNQGMYREGIAFLEENYPDWGEIVTISYQKYMSVLNDLEVFYFRIPLNNVPFEKLPFQMPYKYAYCRYYSTSLLCQEEPSSNIIGVYDYLSDEPINNYSILLNKDWLFGEVLTYPPPLRGAAKWSIIGKMPINSVNIRLPHFKFGKNDSWFYLKDGKYYLFAGVKASKEKVNHLEPPNINAENTIKLRIIIELLKRESLSRKLEITKKEWENIAFMVLRSEHVHKKNADERIREFVSNLLPDMLDQPVYSKIPPEIRGIVAEK